jgi:hypothetical protein
MLRLHAGIKRCEQRFDFGLTENVAHDSRSASDSGVMPTALRGHIFTIDSKFMPTQSRGHGTPLTLEFA